MADFNPHEHIIQLKSKAGSQDYLPVQWRLVWFREQCPQGTIETEMLHLDMDRECEEEAYVWNNEKKKSEKVIKLARGIAVFHTIAKDGKGGIAHGTKSEKAVSFPDYIEKAETGSIGRALAALGYGTQFVAGEFDEGHRIVDSPVDMPQNGHVKPSEVDEAKTFIGKVFSFKQEDSDKRWASYKVHVLGVPKADPDLSAVELAKLRGFAVEEEKKQKSAKASANGQAA